jgi:hypothetical protein
MPAADVIITYTTVTATAVRHIQVGEPALEARLLQLSALLNERTGPVRLAALKHLLAVLDSERTELRLLVAASGAAVQVRTVLPPFTTCRVLHMCARSQPLLRSDGRAVI